MLLSGGEDGQDYASPTNRTIHVQRTNPRTFASEFLVVGSFSCPCSTSADLIDAAAFRFVGARQQGDV